MIHSSLSRMAFSACFAESPLSLSTSGHDSLIIITVPSLGATSGNVNEVKRHAQRHPRATVPHTIFLRTNRRIVPLETFEDSRAWFAFPPRNERTYQFYHQVNFSFRLHPPLLVYSLSQLGGYGLHLQVLTRALRKSKRSLYALLMLLVLAHGIYVLYHRANVLDIPSAIK
ncbi:hypothetical protein AB1N83_013885 [Pleurotus pulmonarius]